MEKCMYRAILVPLDGSPFGEQALPLALSIARRAGVGLHLISVHAPITTPAMGDRPLDYYVASDLGGKNPARPISMES
jgi:nucleotide-binding universal stress UspA family protein